MVPEEPKPSWLLKQFHTECIFFFSSFLLVEREPIHCVNEPGKSNSKKQWDFRWGANCTKVMLDWSRDPWGEKKNSHFYTIEDTAVIFAVSRVFIIDFPLRHNGRPIMKGLSFLFLCVVPWWGQWLKVAGAHLCCRSHCSLKNSGWSGVVEVAGKSSRYQKYILMKSWKKDRLIETLWVCWKAMASILAGAGHLRTNVHTSVYSDRCHYWDVFQGYASLRITLD